MSARTRFAALVRLRAAAPTLRSWLSLCWSTRLAEVVPSRATSGIAITIRPFARSDMSSHHRRRPRAWSTTGGNELASRDLTQYPPRSPKVIDFSLHATTVPVWACRCGTHAPCAEGPPVDPGWPGLIICSLPRLSLCSTLPAISQVTVCSPMCGCGGTRIPAHAVHRHRPVVVDEAPRAGAPALPERQQPPDEHVADPGLPRRSQIKIWFYGANGDLQVSIESAHRGSLPPVTQPRAESAPEVRR